MADRVVLKKGMWESVNCDAHLHPQVRDHKAIARDQMDYWPVEGSRTGRVVFVFKMIHNCQRLLLGHRDNDKALGP